MARAVDGVQLSDGIYLADLTEAVGAAAFDFQVGAVPEFSFPTVDRDRELSRRGLLAEGTTLRWDGRPWQVAAVERDYRGGDVWLTFTARSRLSRRLRNMTGKASSEKSTPQQWITQQVKKAGGTAIVEPGAGRLRIVQKRGESVLDVIANVASDTGVEWVEVDGVFYVGTPWWAYKEDLGLPSWSARVDGTVPDLDFGSALSVVSFSSRSSLDDRQNAAEAELVVEVARGTKVRPWHKVDLSRATTVDNGTWLVDSVSFTEGQPEASIGLQRPLKSSPKKASQGAAQGTSQSGDSPTSAALDESGGWIQGADRVWPRCSRTPRQYVAWALGQINQPFEYNRCLKWVSIAVSGAQGLGGDYARYVWENAPSSAIRSPGDTSPPAGAIVVWRITPSGNQAGHIGISIGGGKFISATGSRVVILDIGGFGGAYYGAMTPSF